MSDGLPTEEQLRRMEQRVMTRIRRRAQLPKRIATGAAAAALVVGGVFLLPRLGTSSGGGSGSSAGYAGDASGGGGSTALLARCHAAASATSPVRTVPLGRDTPAAAIDACLRALTKRPAPSSGTATEQLRALTAKDLVACRDAGGGWQVFVRDAHPSTLCKRNGMTLP
jgi:hypothetical protein